MKCSICNSEEHFRANCPQNQGGKGGKGKPSSSSVVPFSGFSGYNGPVLATHVSQEPSSSREVAPPWGDDLFEAPSEVFTTFGTTNEYQSLPMNGDPWIGNDPWQAAAAENHRQVAASRERNPQVEESRWANWRGIYGSQPPGQSSGQEITITPPKVANDELSDAQRTRTQEDQSAYGAQPLPAQLWRVQHK